VQRGNDLVFEVLNVVDRTDLVRLDIDNGTLTSEEVERTGPGVTRVIVAGQGEGTERLIIQRTTPTAAAAETSWGRVIEEFVDARSSAELVELEQAGDERLIESGSPATSVKVVAADDQTMLYGVDWNEGDLVTAIVSGQETSTTVTAAALIVRAGFVGVGAAIGNVVGFDKNAALVQQVQDIDERVEKIERTSEVGENGAINWADILGKPTQFTPAPHGHAWTEITGKPTEFQPPATTTISRLILTSTGDASPTSAAHGLQIGDAAGFHLRIDGNEIVAVDAAPTTPIESPLYLARPRHGGAQEKVADALVRWDAIQVASGSVNITPVANTPTGVNVAFPAGRFTATPDVVASANSTSNAVTNVTAVSPSSTGVTIYLLRTNTTTTTCYWVAVNVP
jgi:hypothetical protein